LNKIFQSTPRVLLDLQRVIKSDDLRDFTIKVGESQFKVHEFLFVARSPTIAEIIIKNPKADELTLNDIEVEVFRIILDYIYEDKIPENFDENSLKVFAAAGRFKLDHLKSEVGNILISAVNPENSIEILKLASEFGHEELKRKAFEEVKKFLHEDELNDEVVENLELLMKLVNTKIEYEQKMKKMKKEIDTFITHENEAFL
jgi:hypothetical protein